MGTTTPHDHQFKILSDEDPRGLMAFFGILPLEAQIEFDPIDREINLPTKHVDFAYLVRAGGRKAIQHVEATTTYSHLDFEGIADYSMVLEIGHQVDVFTYIVIMTDRGMPEQVREYVRIKRGSNERIHTPRYIKVWELPASWILEVNRPSLLPWTIVADSTRAQKLEAVRRIVARNDRDLAARLMTFCGLRYGREEAAEILEVLNQMIGMKQMEESWVVQDWMDRGREEGREEGRKEGRESGELQGERRFLRIALTTKFGDLPDWAIARVDAAGRQTLESWFRGVGSADSLEAALRLQ